MKGNGVLLVTAREYRVDVELRQLFYRERENHLPVAVSAQGGTDGIADMSRRFQRLAAYERTELTFTNEFPALEAPVGVRHGKILRQSVPGLHTLVKPRTAEAEGA